MKLVVGDIEGLEAQLDRLGGREGARRIVDAGCMAAIDELKRKTAAKGHIVTGSMQESFAKGIYHESIDRCWQDVYPQGTDPRGVDNAKKAFIINFGRGNKRTKKTGDKFITGKDKTMEEAVCAAMRAEAERIKNEIMR